MGDGTRVKFWKHVLCGDCSLKEAFPKLYGFSRANDSSMAEVMGWFGGQLHWSFLFHRSPQDWEEESFDWFVDIVYSSKVRWVGLDKVCWKLARSRGFEVSSFYVSFYPPSLSFPWRLVWHSKVPRRAAFFSWSASLGKILTTDNLCKRRIGVLVWFYMCKRCGVGGSSSTSLSLS